MWVCVCSWIQESSNNLQDRDYETAYKVWTGKEVLLIFHGLGITADTFPMLQVSHSSECCLQFTFNMLHSNINWCSYASPVQKGIFIFVCVCLLSRSTLRQCWRRKRGSGWWMGERTLYRFPPSAPTLRLCSRAFLWCWASCFGKTAGYYPLNKLSAVWTSFVFKSWAEFSAGCMIFLYVLEGPGIIFLAHILFTKSFMTVFPLQEILKLMTAEHTAE